MTENNESATQSAPVTKGSVEDSARKFEEALRNRLKQPKQSGQKKEKKEKVAPDPIETKHSLQVDLGKVWEAVREGYLEDTPYLIKHTGGASVQISLGETPVGSVKGGIGPKVVNNRQVNVGEVDEINVQAGYQRRGLGYVLAIAFLYHCEQEGATYMQLGTPDTSEGFWTSVNVAQNRLIKINEVKEKVKSFTVRW